MWSKLLYKGSRPISPRGLHRMPRYGRTLTAVAAAAATVSLASACSGTASGSSGHNVSLVAYSTPQTAYSALIPAFNKTTAGKDVTFSQSFDASGSQSRAVLAGQPADVVEFSLEPDMTKLVDAGLVPQSWNQNQYHGMVTDSVVVLVVRKGNPKGIHGWDDLVKPGIKIVTPNIFSSGSARWNLMAAYGAQLKQGKSPAQALGFVQALLKNTVAQPESGSKATEAFTSGTGDVLLSYENEAIKAQKAGADVDFVTPPQTILIENPIAFTTAGAKKPAAK